MNRYCNVLYQHVLERYADTALDQLEGVLRRLFGCRYEPQCPHWTACRHVLSDFLAQRPEITEEQIARLSHEDTDDPATYRFRTIHDILDVMARIAKLHPELSSIELALWELMVNAVEHGNLEIGFEAKTDLLKCGMVIDEIEKRLEDPRFKDRTATIRVDRRMDRSIVWISDEGPGFDWRHYTGKILSDVDGLHGRGVLLARANVNDLSYVGNGNTVVVEHFGKSEPALA